MLPQQIWDSNLRYYTNELTHRFKTRIKLVVPICFLLLINEFRFNTYLLAQLCISLKAYILSKKSMVDFWSCGPFQQVKTDNSNALPARLLNLFRLLTEPPICGLWLDNLRYWRKWTNQAVFKKSKWIMDRILTESW